MRTRQTALPWLTPGQEFPPVQQAWSPQSPAPGLLAAGGALDVATLCDAYAHGIFPWFSEDQPILWWSPDPRMVLFPAELKVSRSLRKTLKKPDYEVRVDTAFAAVMRACAAPREGAGGTWISDEMVAAYGRLHEQGLAHSVESWRDGELIGGLYGVALGRMFYGESMFSRATDASKIAFVHLVKQLERWGFGMIDCQMKTAHLATLGAREIPRSAFVQGLSQLIELSHQPGRWQFDHDLIE
jgi:leucyl/phenylalanyl-tRNA--protein transferase